MTSTVLIPAKIQNTAPKPTKAQIAEALLARARAAFLEEEAKKLERREQLIEQCRDLILEEFKKKKATPDDVNVMENWFHGDPNVQIKVTSPKIAAVRKKIFENDKSYFQEDEMKKKIREGLAAPNPLLGNEDAAKALDALLKTIMQPAAPALSNTVDV